MKGWRTQKLGDLLKIQNGYAFTSTQFGDKGMPLIRIRDLANGIKTETRYDGEYDQRYVVRCGDLLIGMDGEFACFEWMGDDALLNQRVCRLESFSDQIDRRFVRYGIGKFLKDIEAVTSFATVKHISSKQILDIPFSYPPLAEQKRIVAILDEAFAGIAKATANAERNLVNAREVLPTLLDRLLTNAEGAQVVDLEQLVDSDCSLSYGIVQPGDEVENGMPIVRPTDLGAREIGLEGLKRINPSRAAGYQRTTLKGRDLLLCVRGTTGVVSQASSELAGANVTRGIVPIRFRGDVLHQDLGYFVLLSQGVQQQIRAATYGAALMQINIRDVRKIRVSVPPVHQQSHLLGQLDTVSSDADRLDANYVRQLGVLAELKSSILHKAFSGQLTGKEAIAA